MVGRGKEEMNKIDDKLKKMKRPKVANITIGESMSKKYEKAILQWFIRCCAKQGLIIGWKKSGREA